MNTNDQEALRVSLAGVETKLGAALARIGKMIALDRHDPGHHDPGELEAVRANIDAALLEMSLLKLDLKAYIPALKGRAA